MNMKRYFPFMCGLAFIILGLLIRKALSKPFEWNFCFLFFALAGFCFAAQLRGAVGRVGGIVMGSLFLGLFCAETWLIVATGGGYKVFDYQWVPIETIRQERNEASLMPVRDGVVDNDPLLGFRPVQARGRYAMKTLYKGQPALDFVYSTMENGWRVTPPRPRAKSAVVFFGCSFTHGTGLADEETIPWQVAELLGEDVQTFNFAFGGWGSHQMLAQVQSGLLDELIPRFNQVLVVYATIEGHELRPVTSSSWDLYGPRYVLENGEAQRRGNFQDILSSWAGPVYKLFRNCFLFNALNQPKKRDHDKHVALHAAIIAKTDEELRQRYGLRLNVVLWPGVSFTEALSAKGLPLLDLARVFPDNEAYQKDYLIPHDEHPNALAARVASRAIADYAKTHWQVPDMKGP